MLTNLIIPLKKLKNLIATVDFTAIIEMQCFSNQHVTQIQYSKGLFGKLFFFYGEKSLYDPSMSKNTELIFGKVHDKFGKIKIFFHMMEGCCQIAVIDEIT